MMRQCLLVVDMLNDFLDKMESGERGQLVQKTNTLIAACRSHEVPIVWVKQEFRPDLSDAFLEMRDKQISITIAGTSGAQFHDELDFRESDTQILKKRYSAFFKTPLEDVLNELNITHLILAGVNTHACVRMAAIDAYQRDLRVVLATDCIASNDREHHDVSLRYMKDKIAITRTNSQIEDVLSGAQYSDQ
jgi:bifunctional isochorismate lyase/aryl carrier protein